MFINSAIEFSRSLKYWALSLALVLALILLGLVLAGSANGREPQQKRIDYFRYQSKSISNDTQQCSCASLLIDFDFKHRSVQLTRTLLVYGSHAPVVHEMRIERFKSIPAELRPDLLKALNEKYTADLVSESSKQQTSPWWCRALWTTFHPDPLHDEPEEYFCWGGPGRCNVVSFYPEKPPAGRLALRKATMEFLQEVKIDQAPKGDEIVSEEGDDVPARTTVLKNLLHGIDKYKGKRVSVVGWPVMADCPGSFAVDLSPRGPFFVGLAIDKASAKQGSDYLPVSYMVSSVTQPDLIKPNYNGRLRVEGVLSSAQAGPSQNCDWTEDPGKLRLIRATRIEPAP